MPTEKQSAASRANSQHSTGPRTTESKAKSRFNALKHGIYAESQIIFTESAEDLAELAAEYHEHYLPADPAERCLVDALIETEWRLRRMRRVEAGIWADKHSSLLRYKTLTEDDPSKRAVTPGEIFSADDAKFATLQRVISSCHRDYRGALKELRALVVAGHARPSASATGIPACRPATDTPEPEPESPEAQPIPPASSVQPEQSKPTSASPASFPQTPSVVAGHARPSAEPTPPLAGPTADPARKLPEAA